MKNKYGEVYEEGEWGYDILIKNESKGKNRLEELNRLKLENQNLKNELETMQKMLKTKNTELNEKNIKIETLNKQFLFTKNTIKKLITG